MSLPTASRARAIYVMLAWFLAKGVSAQPAAPRIILEWPSDAPCAPPPAVDTEVARLLGERHATLPVTTFHVELKQTAQASYELSLHFSASELDRARTLRLSSCGEVQEAAILLAAMALQPEAEAAPEAPPAPPPEPEQDAEPARSTRPVSARIDVAGLLDLRSLPAVSGGPAMGVSLTYGAWLAGLSGRYLAPREVHDVPAGTQAKIDLAAAALVLGYRVNRGRLHFGPVAELELGYLRGRATGTLDGGNAGALWACAWGGLSAASGLGASEKWRRRVELSLSALFGLPLTRPRFALQGESAFYTTNVATLRFFLGVSFALGATD